MKGKIKRILVSTLTALCVAGCGASTTGFQHAAAQLPAPSVTPTSPTNGWLFVQNSVSGSLSGTPGVLSLEGVDSTLAFADRPVRTVETLSVAEFVGLFSRAFASSPPNGVLEFRQNGQWVSYALELANPRLSGTTLTYDVRPLQEIPRHVSGPRQLASGPANFGAAALFIDNAEITTGTGTGEAVITTVTALNVDSPGPIAARIKSDQQQVDVPIANRTADTVTVTIDDAIPPQAFWSLSADQPLTLGPNQSGSLRMDFIPGRFASTVPQQVTTTLRATASSIPGGEAPITFVVTDVRKADDDDDDGYPPKGDN
jgi:hypothetical protein